MAMGVESQEIPEGLDGNGGAGECILLRDNGLEKDFQRVPCASAEIGEMNNLPNLQLPLSFRTSGARSVVR